VYLSRRNHAPARVHSSHLAISYSREMIFGTIGLTGSAAGHLTLGAFIRNHVVLIKGQAHWETKYKLIDQISRISASVRAGVNIGYPSLAILVVSDCGRLLDGHEIIKTV
jgi:hypothetical protein